jgi:hypothetical protein
MGEFFSKRRSVSVMILLLPALPTLADTVVQPLSIIGEFDTLATSQNHDAETVVDMGITFAQISSAGLRIDAFVNPGSVRILGSQHVEPLLPLSTATLLDDDRNSAAFGEILLPYNFSYDDVLAMDSNWGPSVADYSSLLDGKGEVRFSVNAPLLTANLTIEKFPSVHVRASALVVTGETLGRLAGDFDGDGAVFVEDFEFFKRTFGQHVTPGTGADGNGNGVVDVADYTIFREHLGASIRPTDGYLAGDFDYSGAVDPADFDFWKARFGQNVAPFSGADGNGDGIVDAADYRVFRDQLGRSLPSYTSSTASVVPEPGGALLLMLSSVMFSLLPRRR